LSGPTSAVHGVLIGGVPGCHSGGALAAWAAPGTPATTTSVIRAAVRLIDTLLKLLGPNQALGPIKVNINRSDSVSDPIRTGLGLRSRCAPSR
jgi:hypothetical protein